MRNTRFLLSGLLAAACVAPAAAQSVSVTAGSLHGSAQAGQSVANSNPCRGHGMTVRSAGGNASSSVSVSSSDGQTVMAGAGSPGSTITHYDCRKTKHHR